MGSLTIVEKDSPCNDTFDWPLFYMIDNHMIPEYLHPHCPLCRGKEIDSFFEDTQRVYLRCMQCQLVFVPERFWLSPEDERATYDLHENDAGDIGYRHFLSRLTIPLLERVKPEQKGLDFGCGPGPTLSVVLEEAGYSVDLYDPFFYNDPAVFHKKYDFICTTEVVEHLRYPGQDFTTLFKLLKPGGWLGVMTKLVIDRAAFRKWHYIRDLTHICFYSQSTFEHIAQRFDACVDLVNNDVILLNKNN
jgi:SAM-dependent methyltransferase